MAKLARDRSSPPIVPLREIGSKSGRVKSTLYFSVNELKPGVSNRKGAKNDVGRALSGHVDVDDLSALDRVRKHLPKPTAVVFSGGGYQAFWKLSEPSTDLARVERINLEIAQRLGGDNCHNIDRIMRLPGTINVPNARKRAAGRVPTLAYVVEDETDWSRLYSLDDFDDPTPAAPAARVAATLARVGPINLDQLLPSCFGSGADSDRTRRRHREPDRLDERPFSIAQRGGVARRLRIGPGRLQRGTDRRHPPEPHLWNFGIDRRKEEALRLCDASGQASAGGREQRVAGFDQGGTATAKHAERDAGDEAHGTPLRQ
jgi:hypothetical protein